MFKQCMINQGEIYSIPEHSGLNTRHSSIPNNEHTERNNEKEQQIDYNWRELLFYEMFLCIRKEMFAVRLYEWFGYSSFLCIIIYVKQVYTVLTYAFETRVARCLTFVRRTLAPSNFHLYRATEFALTNINNNNN